ncbi:DUF6783 domain-containing protein, partial [Blautia sp.]|uniref:DUF6783 domain-containing protein n=1 Tax=Blautia sp. TaxID=1955243 RepID=UPI003FA462A1
MISSVTLSVTIRTFGSTQFSSIFISIFIRYSPFHGSRACLKNHFRNLQAPLCGIFYPHSVAVARYAALIR